MTDDGIGFDQATVRAGNGLKNLRRRAAELHGAITIESSPGQGTRIHLTAGIP